MMMFRSMFAATTAIALTAGVVTAALAATQEYQITVPVTIKGKLPTGVLAPGPTGSDTGGVLNVTVSCAVGGPSVALTGGQAVNAAGTGSAKQQLKNAGGVYQADVLVDFTASVDATIAGTGKPPTNYVCWTVLDKAPDKTPVNFISGVFKQQ